MYYGLKIHLYTGNLGLIGSVKTRLQNASRIMEADFEVIDGEYEVEIDNIIESLSAEISFSDDTERQNIVGLLSAITGMINACEKPSVIYGFDNNRPEGQPDVRTTTYLEAV